MKADAIPNAAYAVIDYLETDGKQSINTGFVPGAAASCTVDMAPSDVGSSTKPADQNYFFASRTTTMGSHTSAQSALRVTKNASDALYLFGSTVLVNTMFRGKFYSCKITDAGEAVRDLVPCVRLSDGTLGVYDLSGTSENPFYGNVGTADFPNAAEAWAGAEPRREMGPRDIASALRPGGGGDGPGQRFREGLSRGAS